MHRGTAQMSAAIRQLPLMFAKWSSNSTPVKPKSSSKAIISSARQA
jgi:hypothetical protein